MVLILAIVDVLEYPYEDVKAFSMGPQRTMAWVPCGPPGNILVLPLSSASG